MPITRARLSIFLLATLPVVGCYYGSSSSETPSPDLGSDTTANPPGQVGRIDYIEGAVSFRPAEADTWAFAELNRTVTTGDRLWVDTIGHAELEVGPNAVRVGPETELDAVHIDDDLLQLRVPQGMINLRIRTFDEDASYEIDAPNAAITANKAGDYRVDVSPDGNTTKVTVHSGAAHVTSGGSTFQVNAQQTATIQGDSTTTYDIAPATGPDPFDDWTLSRDAREDQPSVSTRYVSPDMGGTTDLDDAGTWSDNPDYGPVWFPTGVAVGWAPYEFGHWVWIDPWGWTWIDDEPWGWAPFHYGRWAFVGGAWGWCPGPVIYTPVYAPGLVAFVGGPGWAFGVGWFPLAPHEPWFPPYRHDFAYRERINATNYTNISEVRNPNPGAIPYHNRTIPGAVTAVPSHAFAGGEPISHIMQHPGPNDLATAHVVGFNPDVPPTRASLAAGIGRTTAIPPRTVETRPVLAIHAPPPRPVPFSAQEHVLATNGGRPLNYTERTALREPTVSSEQTTRFRSAVAPGRTLAPARPGLAPTRPATQALFDRSQTTGSAHSTLDNSYRAEHAQLEQRHIQEYAQPHAAESQSQLFQRQELEHHDMQARYNVARSSGMSRMPAPHFAGGGGGHVGGGRPR